MSTAQEQVTGVWATLFYGPSGAPGGRKLERKRDMMKDDQVRLLRQRILDSTQEAGVTTIPRVMEQFDLTYPAAQSHLARLVSMRLMRREERDKTKLGTNAPESVSRYFVL